MVAFLGDTPAVNKAGRFKEGVSFAVGKCRLATSTDIQTKVGIQSGITVLCVICAFISGLYMDILFLFRKNFN